MYFDPKHQVYKVEERGGEHFLLLLFTGTFWSPPLQLNHKFVEIKNYVLFIVILHHLTYLHVADV